MMKPTLVALTAAVVVAATPAFAQNCDAGCYGSYEHTAGERYKASYLQNSMWPSQYIPPARRAAITPFARMVHNGWRRQNLIGAKYFDDATGALTEAGQLKTEWVLTQAPPSRRQLFVEKTADDLVVSQRTDAIRQYAKIIAPAAALDEIAAVEIRDRGRPATIVDQNFTGFHANLPVPVLPVSGGTGTAGQGGSN